MKHRISGRKLGRDMKQRKALFRSLATSFIDHGFIETSLAKAKTVQPILEKLITKAQTSTAGWYRGIYPVFQDRIATQRFIEIAKKSGSGRTSGFTTIERRGIRKGDAVPLVRLLWVHRSNPTSQQSFGGASKRKTEETEFKKQSAPASKAV